MNYYNKIKEELINNEVYKKVKDYSKNKSDLNAYYNVGKLLNDAGKNYGESIIKTYSIKLTKELGKGYTFTALTRMKKFYLLINKIATVSQHLSYGHYVELLPIKDYEKVKYYISITEKQKLSIRQLRDRIKKLEYERLPIETREKLISKEENKVSDFIKNPILIKNSYNYEEISEKILKQLILEDLDNFLMELGEGFTYIKNEYKIKLGDRYNYIDLLLYNIKFRCYIVVELKVTELKKEHIGQLKFYMNYVDENIKSIEENKTVGIIICKYNNSYVIKYCSDERIIARSYELV